MVMAVLSFAMLLAMFVSGFVLSRWFAIACTMSERRCTQMLWLAVLWSGTMALVLVFFGRAWVLSGK